MAGLEILMGNMIYEVCALCQKGCVKQKGSGKPSSCNKGLMGMVVSLHPPRKKQRFLPKNNDVCDVLDGGWFLSQEAARCKLVGKPQ